MVNSKKKKTQQEQLELCSKDLTSAEINNLDSCMQAMINYHSCQTMDIGIQIPHRRGLEGSSVHTLLKQNGLSIDIW